MNDRELINRKNALIALKNSEGWRILHAELERLQNEGWENFIDLPVEQKTNKTAFFYQAQFRAVRDIIRWINDEIRAGEQAEKITIKEVI